MPTRSAVPPTRPHVSRRAVVLLTLALLGPLLPSLAAAHSLPVIPPLVRSAALGLGATTAAVGETDRLIGVTWATGAPQVHVRWLTAAGWSGWEIPEDDSAVPEPAERATARSGTEPLWRPPGASLVELRVDGAAGDLQLVRVGDGAAQRSWSFGLRPAGADGGLPGIRSRADWGADESLRRGAPDYAAAVKAVVVHHTAGSNNYGPAEVPSRIRADYAYHVQARGWSDLGYNVVVDKFGGIWEGRAGGVGRATIGAHAEGFNTGTLGVALLGDMTRATPTPEAVRAVARVSAYAAGVWDFDPTGKVVLTSGGSPKHSSGTAVTLPRVHGHRDVGLTACPGTLYDRLGEVRRVAASLVPPGTVGSVTVTGTPVSAPSPVVITGTLSRTVPWTADIRDSGGAVVASATGESGTARLEWNGLRQLPAVGLAAVVPAEPGSYSWTITTGAGLRPGARREGTIEVGPPLLRTAGWR